MVRSIFGKVMWVGRATVLLVGLTVILALVFGVVSRATAHDGFAGLFHLNHSNTVTTALTKLTGNVAGPALQVVNSSTGRGATGLSLSVASNKPPVTVNPAAGTATGFSADELDGQDSSEFMTPGSTLSSGQTITGIWAAASVGDGSSTATGYAVAPIEFHPKLGSDIVNPNTHYMINTTSAVCPGPGQADPGHLCVYRESSGGAGLTFRGFHNPESTTTPFTAGGSGASQSGAALYFTTSNSAGTAHGTWAVTAP